MTEKKRRKFAHELLGLIAISALVALVLFLILTYFAAVAVEEYCFQNDVIMTEFDWIEVDRWIFGLGGGLAILCFSILFLFLLRERIAYVQRITARIDRLADGTERADLPLEGNNELTDLARAVNEMALARQRLRQAEQALAQEKDRLIRELSHDIRTPLTAIQAYSEYLEDQGQTSSQQQEYAALIRRKAQQIRELTDVLLEGSKRQVQQFEDAALLMAQIVAEWEAELEDRFSIQTDLSGCQSIPGSFDLQQLQRIFDNLASNLIKYADPAVPVTLIVTARPGKLEICQRNAILGQEKQTDSYGIGLNSIRRIAQDYDGQVTVTEDGQVFAITVTLCRF